MSGLLDIGLYIGYFLLAAALLVAIGMPLIQVIGSPASIKKPAIAIGSIVILGLLAYLVSSSHVTAEQASLGVSPGTSKLIGTGLIMLYAVLGIAFIGLIYSEIKKISK